MKTEEENRIVNLNVLHTWPTCGTCREFITKKECPYPATQSNYGVCY